MNRKNYPLSCIAVLGLLIAVAFAAFIAASSLVARAEDSFGPPSPALGVFQRARLGVELGWRADELLTPADPNASPTRFDIALGEPTDQIVSRLWTSDLVAKGNLFSNYLIYTGLDTQLQAGSFQLSAAMSPVELTQALLDPTPESVTLVILPGWRLEEIAAALPSAGVSVKPEDFLLAAWTPPADLQLPATFPSGASLEGYLLPGSYEIERTAGAPILLNTLLSNLGSQVSDQMLQEFSAQGLDLHQALTVASIVEREAVDEAEMPLIASVFLNRFHAGIKLEADPTVQYALGYDTSSKSWWKTSLSLADLAVDSQYNTYLYLFPPGPIAAPSVQALQAVAFPASSTFYFFQAACDGSGAHVFAETFEEHLVNNCP